MTGKKSDEPELIVFSGKGVVERKRILLPDTVTKETRLGRIAKQRAKRVRNRVKKKTNRKRIDSFTMQMPFLDANNKMRSSLSPSQRKQAEMFVELYVQDYAESKKLSLPLSRPEREYAVKLANNGMTKSKNPIEPEKKVFVTTVKERKGTKIVDVPVGYMFYWVTPGGKYKSDRIFVRDSHRGRGLAPRIAFRSLGRAFLERLSEAKTNRKLSGLSTAEYVDAHPSKYATEKAVVKPLESLGLIQKYELKGQNLCIYLNRAELLSEVALIRSHDRWRETPFWDILRKPKLVRVLAERRRRNIERWQRKPTRRK